MKSRFISVCHHPGPTAGAVVQRHRRSVIWTVVWVLVGMAVHSRGVDDRRGGQAGAERGQTVSQATSSRPATAPITYHWSVTPSASRSPRPARPLSTSPAPATTWTPPRPGWPWCWRWRLRRRRSWGGGAVAVAAHPVLPAQMDRDHPGRDAGRCSSCWRCARWPTGRCVSWPPSAQIRSVPGGVGDPGAIRGLAALELRSAGISVRLR